MSKKNILIVGGGIIGIVLSKFLSLSKKYNITILDNSNRLGGFLKSVKIKKFTFDLGTHYIRETGNKNVDKILFRKIKKKWINLNFLKSGNYFKKKIVEHNQFVNIKELNEYKNSLDEILQKSKSNIKNKFKNEHARCIAIFGKIITKKIIAPIMLKYTGLKLQKIPAGLSSKFALGRIIINNKDLTLKLKKQKKFDNYIAFETNREGVSNEKNYYPKKGCVDEFVKYFLEKNTKVMLNKSIKNFNIKKNFINEVVFSDNQIIKFDKIFWTAPKNLYFKILRKPIVKGNTKKIFWKFTNLTSNKKFMSKCFYLNIHDPKTNIYRITLYDNLQKNRNNRMTVESVSPKEKFSQETNIKKYLLKINLISKNQKINFLNSITITVGIPLRKEKLLKKNNIKNIEFIGGGFFNQRNQEKTIIDAYDLTKKKYG